MHCRESATCCAACSQVCASGSPLSALMADCCAKCCEVFPEDKHCKAYAEECRKCETSCKAVAKSITVRRERTSNRHHAPLLGRWSHFGLLPAGSLQQLRHGTGTVSPYGPEAEGHRYRFWVPGDRAGWPRNMFAKCLQQSDQKEQEIKWGHRMMAHVGGRSRMQLSHKGYVLRLSS